MKWVIFLAIISTAAASSNVDTALGCTDEDIIVCSPVISGYVNITNYLHIHILNLQSFQLHWITAMVEVLDTVILPEQETTDLNTATLMQN